MGAGAAVAGVGRAPFAPWDWPGMRPGVPGPLDGLPAAGAGIAWTVGNVARGRPGGLRGGGNVGGELGRV